MTSPVESVSVLAVRRKEFWEGSSLCSNNQERLLLIEVKKLFVSWSEISALGS